MILAIELLLLLAVALLGWAGAKVAIQQSLDAAALRGQVGDPGGPLAAAEAAGAWFVGAVVVVAAARTVASRRRGAHLPVPWLFPAALAAAAMGLAVQLGYGSPWRSDWPGPEFGPGVFYGALCAAVILLLPGDPHTWLNRGRWVFAGVSLGLLGLLYAFGDAPGQSDQRINLGPVQPIEAVKIAATLFIAEALGRRAARIRFQRTRLGPLRLPRARLLLPALVALASTLLGLLVVGDLGPTLILGGVFLAMFFVVSRSPGWVLLAVGLGALVLALLAAFPEATPFATLETRLRMWVDPWLNGLPYGEQIAKARWALAAGGRWGVGLGAGHPDALPAGHTDLVYAHLVEELGLAGAALWLLLLGAVVGAGLWVAAGNRTPERVLAAAGLSFLLFFQAATILGGTLGLVPLTGVVVPFLSYGKTSMAAFLGVVALLARLAEDGAVRADLEELQELRAAVRAAGFGLAAAGFGFFAVTAVEAVVRRDATTLRPAVTTLGDGSVALVYDPRLKLVADAIRRGSILDRDGEPLAVSPHPGTRITPLGNALGTVLGPADGSLLRAPWSLERIHDARLRGYPDAEDGPAIWLGRVRGRERLVLAVPSARREHPEERARAEARLTALGGEGPIRRLPLAAPDYRPLLDLVRLPLDERGPAVEARSDAVESRSVRVTLDARLQAKLAPLAARAARLSQVGAAAVVVLDPATGQVLARAQWPDYDPGESTWRAKRLQGDPKFLGIYGPWADKTGAHGVYQAGSVFKVLTAIAAVRAGKVTGLTVPEGATCPSASGPVYPCRTVIDGKVAFTRPGWTRPIHDYADGGATGDLDLVTALTKSSNVYFGQLALDLGPEAFRALRAEGVEFGNPGLLEEAEGEFTGFGAGGSRRLAQTGFGQGAGSWNVTQAARLVGAVANGGTYRRCPPDLRLDAECPAVRLVEEDTALLPVLAGMRGVMEQGTGRKLPKVPGVRIYGKTGTADAPGTRDEAPWGIRPAQSTRPHSWFVAIAEPESAEACAPGTPGRYVVAAVVPHGGLGGSAAGPLAIDTIRALQEVGRLPAP